MKIGIAGAKGSFSEEAAREYCRNEGVENVELVYLTFVENVLTALDRNEIDKGIFGIENSNGGVVLEYLPTIAEHRFKIQKMLEIDVRQTLMVLPGTLRENVHTIVSQKQAINQCRMYLKRIWPNADVVEYIDTAKAAEDLANGTLSPNSATIGSRTAAQVYGLEVLEDNINDLKFNFTTFIVAEPFAKV